IRELSEGQIQEKAAELIGQHPVSSFGSFLLKRYLMNVNNPNLALVNNALESMIKAQPQHLNLKNMQEKIQSLISVSKGGKAPEFTVKDNQGIEHKLSDYKGKDFILVFGASWAEDYREQLRAIKSDLESMESPLEVINIVMDQNRPTIRSIMRDSIPGATIPEGRNWFSEIAQDYQILTLPTFFLIDKNQKIVAREEEWTELKKQIK
ncbi:MAG: TlpA family protein disulfide reductase, partial [Bacteroidaceae bacterium]|nr:TlpA family protein disulfide reductase [Bacteroidaceae bacterium]